MRSDCLTKCLTESNETTKCVNCVLKVGSLLRKDVYSKYPSAKYCENLKYETLYDKYNSFLYGNYSGYKARYSLKHELFSNNKCLKSCEEWIYLYELKEKSEMTFSPWDVNTFVRIKRDHLLDQHIEHLPEMSFIEFICGFGGLLGMWLGLSALAILHFILQLIEN